MGIGVGVGGGVSVGVGIGGAGVGAGGGGAGSGCCWQPTIINAGNMMRRIIIRSTINLLISDASLLVSLANLELKSKGHQPPPYDLTVPVPFFHILSLLNQCCNLLAAEVK